MGINYYAVKKKPTIKEPLHIGKSSVGWRFLFQEIHDFDLNIASFYQWKKWLIEHIEKDYVILDEYDKKVKLKKLLKLIEEKQKNNNSDNFTDCKNIDGYRFTDSEFS